MNAPMNTTYEATPAAYTRFVDLLYVIVLTISVEKSISLFAYVFTTDFFLLILSFVVIALSYVHYFFSMKRYPYTKNTWAWIRFALDSIVVICFSGLVLFVASVPNYGVVLSVIYLIYSVRGLVTVLEYGSWYETRSTRPRSTPAFWFLYAVYFLGVSRYPWTTLFSASNSLNEAIAISLYVFGIVSSRIIRHSHRYGRTVVAGTLAKLRLQPRPPTRKRARSSSARRLWPCS